MSKIIAIANQKGGVGKTTTTINLGAALVKEKKKVLIIDLDEQTNTTIGLGLNRELINTTSYDLLLSYSEIETCVYPLSLKGLTIIPSSNRMATIEKDLYKIEKCETILYDKLIKIKEQYDFVLLDCPPSLGIIVDNALYASDSVIIPVECEYYAYDALTQMVNKINQLQKIKKMDDLNLTIEGVLLTKLDNRNLLGYKIVEKVNEMFPTKTFKTIINKSSHLQEAPMYGKSVVEYAFNSRGSKEYRELAKEIIRNNEVE